MIRKSLLIMAAVALLPTLAVAAPTTTATKPVVAHAQTVKILKAKHVIRHHYAVKKAKMTSKAKNAPAKKV
jgi:hypothetical protein